ncbi:hypothetical protein CPC08DRAFT_823693 [Agrocybe pediades]|nr:hypothetical protein CPC08DRAFT_823693 [Agrocybe pediades]
MALTEHHRHCSKHFHFKKIKVRIVKATSDSLKENPRYLTRSVQHKRRLKYRWNHPYAGYNSPNTAAARMTLEQRYKADLITRDTQFWKEDGDVCLVVEAVEFRVHMEKMASAGGVYADMFGEGRFEGECTSAQKPAVFIPDTTAMEFRFLLAILYETSVISTVLPNGKTWLYWEAVLILIPLVERQRLRPIREKIFVGLEMLFPSKADPATPASFKPIIGGMENERHRWGRFFRVFPIQAINLFSQYGNSYAAFMPMACYHVAQLSVEDIVNGVEDGEDDEPVKLLPDFIPICIKGREAVRRSRSTVLFRWIFDIMSGYGPEKASELCTGAKAKKGDKLKCFPFFKKLYTHYRESKFLDGRGNALEGLNDDAVGLFKYYMCDPCYQLVLKANEDGLKENWERLPGYFGLGTWEEVLQAQGGADRAWDS